MACFCPAKGSAATPTRADFVDIGERVATPRKWASARPCSPRPPRHRAAPGRLVRLRFRPLWRSRLLAPARRRPPNGGSVPLASPLSESDRIGAGSRTACARTPAPPTRWLTRAPPQSLRRTARLGARTSRARGTDPPGHTAGAQAHGPRSRCAPAHLAQIARPGRPPAAGGALEIHLWPDHATAPKAYQRSAGPTPARRLAT